MSHARSRIYLICKDPSVIDAIRGAAEPVGNLTLVALAEATEALGGVAREDAALMMVHQESVGGVDGVIALLRAIAEAGRPLPLIAIGDRHRPDQALALLRAGAAECLSRPLDLSRLTYLIDVLTVRARLAGPAPADSTTAGHPAETTGRMMEQVRRVASHDTTILLGGETGTGKTRLARLIHEMSPRRAAPFLVINCGALSSTLIESEMFGHVKGAFTGADRDHVGKFAAVGGGTLLLDEVDSLPLVLQAKLLRAVEERVFEPVGSNKTLPMQARLIAAGNRPLAQEVARGRFRADLHYRLNVMSFGLPPLRERLEIIPALVDQFIAEFADRCGVEVSGISDDAMQALRAHDWPGNIRELRNVIERAVVLCDDGWIRLVDLPDELHQIRPEPAPIPTAPALLSPAPAHAPSLARAKDEAERSRITDALIKHQDNRLRASLELGISRMTLYNKMRKYGMMSAAC
jgi:DNA-binding NtrC family response regulator